MRYFDAHSHIHFEQFDSDRDAVVLRMKDAGVGTITVGCDAATSKKAIEFANAHENIWATVGQHPADNRAEEFDVAIYRHMAEDPKVVAIGECGLDYTRLGGDPEVEKARQKELFRAQAALAQEIGKPLMIHARPSGKDQEQNSDAHDDILEILSEFPDLRIILHFFTGSPETAERYLKQHDAYFSFSGVVTFASMYEKTVRAVPLERILVETDAPYAAPVPHRGERNEPGFVIDTLKYIAQLVGKSEEELRMQTLENVKRVFELDF